MLINVTLICLMGVCALNVLLTFDLYNRSARLVELYEEARRALSSLMHNNANPAE